MSILTQALRNAGFGGLLDAIEAAEAEPSAANIVGAFGAAAAAAPVAAGEAPKLINVAVADVGNLVGQVAVNAITKANPTAGAVSQDVFAQILPAVESAVEGIIAKFL